MKHLSLCGLMIVVAAGISFPCEALEFTAERFSRTGRDIHHARIFYRDNMWRLEYNEPGPVSVTIVRADRNQVWHLIPSIHHFKTESYGSDYALHLTITLDNETSRDFVGTQVLDGHPTALYEVVATGPGGQQETYYQWVATHVGILPSVAAARLILESLRLHGISDEQIGLALHQSEAPLSCYRGGKALTRSRGSHQGGCGRRYHRRARRLADRCRFPSHSRSGSPPARWIAHLVVGSNRCLHCGSERTRRCHRWPRRSADQHQYPETAARH